MKNIKKFLPYILILALNYLGASFIQLELNPYYWRHDDRGILVLLFYFTSIIYLLYINNETFLKDENDKN